MEITFVHWKGAGTQLPANTGGENKIVMQKKVEDILQLKLNQHFLSLRI